MMNQLFGLQGKTALVTGGSSGLGLQVLKLQSLLVGRRL